MKTWSIILVAYNHLEYTKKCLESILENSIDEDYELILVNNGSTDGTQEYFNSIIRPGDTVMHYKTNQIVERVGNIAAQTATGKYLAIVTNDTIVGPDWLKRARWHFENVMDVGLIGIRSNSIGSSEQIVEFPSQDPDLKDGLFFREWGELHDHQHTQTARVCGVVLFTPRDIFLSLGGVDENLSTNGRDGGYGFSDDDLCMRMICEGYKVIIANDIYVHHFGSVTAGPRLASGMTINQKKFIAKLKKNPNIIFKNGMEGSTIQITPQCSIKKRIGVWNFYESLNEKGYMLHNPDAPIGDKLLKPMNDLYIYFRERGIQLLTLDMIADFNAMDSFVFWDMPDFNHPLVKKAMLTDKPKHLVVCEPPVVKMDNWYFENHKKFNKIFTWHDLVIGENEKYKKINMAVNFPDKIYRGPKEKFCCIMASNKKSIHSLELYSERIKTIKWFEKNHPNDFDLYGACWEGYQSWIGFVKEKRSVLKEYKFAICYENAMELPGYITEKIWDCFFAGVIPVYWGAENIEKYIPENCFIDRRKFDHKSLYQHMMLMSTNERDEMLDNIESYLKRDQAKQFTSEHFCKTIWETIK